MENFHADRNGLLPIQAATNEPVQHIHQIFINKSGDLPQQFPESIDLNIKFVKSIYPSAQYNIYSGHQIRKFLRDHFDRDVLKSYDTLAPFAYKCDLARLCVLYVYGGLYIDLGVRLLFPLDINQNTKLLLFRCPLHKENHAWDVENSIMFSVPHRKEIEVAVDLICSNVARRYYGVNTLAPTGPGVIGRAIAIVGEEEDYAMGFSSISNTSLPVNFFNYILPNGKFVATRTKDGRLNVVIKGANDYNNYWHSRIVYGEDVTYKSSDFSSARSGVVSMGQSIGMFDDAISRSSTRYLQDDVGCIVWGPYKYLPEGRYSVTVCMVPGSRVDGIKIDFFDIGIGVIHEQRLEFAEQLGGGKYRLFFHNPFESRLMEVRLHSVGGVSGALDRIVFQRLGVSAEFAFAGHYFVTRLADGGELAGALHAEIIAGAEGCLVWGPYQYLEQGRYRVFLKFVPGIDLNGLAVDFYDKGLGEIYRVDLSTAEMTDAQICVVDFMNPFDLRFLEVRIHSDGTSKGGHLATVVFQPISYHAPIRFGRSDFLLSPMKEDDSRPKEPGLTLCNEPIGVAVETKRRHMPKGSYKILLKADKKARLTGLRLICKDIGIGVLLEHLVTDADRISDEIYGFKFYNNFDSRLFEIILQAGDGNYGNIEHLEFQKIDRDNLDID